MTQFQENARADGRTERRMEGQTGPILKDPSGYHRGSNKPIKMGRMSKRGGKS